MDRPILFNGDMVRAVLDGRKTQTRRIVKPQPVEWRPGSWSWPAAFTTEKPYPWTLAWHEPHRPETIGTCPFGEPGDRLWVRETWSDFCPLWEHWCGCGTEQMQAERHRRIYRADGEPEGRVGWRGKWVPSIHMPRWASRLTLDVVSVRVERLQDITEADALAEGFAPGTEDLLGGAVARLSARDYFQNTWQEIYGFASWDANPWVWVVAFRKSEGGR